MLDDLKLLIGIEDNTHDNLLSYILESVSSRLANLLGVDEIPEEMEYIVVEVSVIRFNRVGSEGIGSHSVEGESMSFTNNDFDQYKNEIQTFIDRNAELNRGKVRFL